MKNRKVVGVGKIIAILVLSLGVVHDIATFTPLIKNGKSTISPVIIYFSLMCGTSLILSGLLQFVMLRKIDQISFLRVPMLIIGIFLALSGILSVIYMPENPFAWAALLINLSMFAVALKISL